MLAAVVAAAPRLVAVFDAFWLDEIWSWSFAREIGSPADIFFRLQHDNNHHLNTLFLYLFGDRSIWAVYRLPSLLAGLATVALGMALARDRGRPTAFITGAILAGSYLLTVYSTEARGYALAIFFAFLCHWLYGRYREKGSPYIVVGLNVLIPLGFLSHLTFGFYWFGFVAISAWRAMRAPLDAKKSVIGLAKLHALPIAFLAAHYFINIRPMVIGGGPEWSLGSVLGEAAALSLGAPVARPFMIAAALAIAIVLAEDAARLYRAGSDEWLFGLSTVVVAPALALMLGSPEALFARYFLVSIAFFLLALGRALGRLFERGQRGRAGAITLLMLYLIGNAVQLTPFLRHGRGHYLEAVEFMARETPGDIVTVASDHDFRNGMVLDFYGRYAPEGKRIEYVDQSSRAARPAEWFIAHSQERAPSPEPALALPSGVVYVLQETFPHHGPSGWHWFVYRRSGI